MNFAPASATSAILTPVDHQCLRRQGREEPPCDGRDGVERSRCAEGDLDHRQAACDQGLREMDVRRASSIAAAGMTGARRA